MSMIRLQNSTPSEYCKQSRDFQLLCRLYDCVVNSLQYDINTIPDILDTSSCRDTILPLLQTKLGFFTNKTNITGTALRYILEVFPLLVKKKGSLQAIQEAVITFLKINNIFSPVSIYYVTETMTLPNGYIVTPNTILIGINASLQDTSLLEEVFRYILPAGIGYYFYFYYTIEELEKYGLEDNAVLLFTTYNINAQLRGSTSTYESLLPVLKSFLIDFDIHQDFNGYSRPWAPGEGPNKLNYYDIHAVESYTGCAAKDETQGIHVSCSNGEECASAKSVELLLEANKTYELSCDVYAHDICGNGWAVELCKPDGTVLMSSGVSTIVEEYVHVSLVYSPPEDTVAVAIFYAMYDGTMTQDYGDVEFEYIMLEDEEYSTIGASIVGISEIGDNDDFRPYSNICPIYGKEKCDIWHSGKNLLDYSSITGMDGLTYGEVLADVHGFRIYPRVGIEANVKIVDIPFIEGTTYTLSFNATVEGLGEAAVSFINMNDDSVLCTLDNIYQSSATHYELSYTHAGDYPVYILFHCNHSVLFTDVQLEIGSSSTSFVPNIPSENLFDEYTSTAYNREIAPNSKWTTSSTASSYAFMCQPLTRYIVKALNTNLTTFRIGLLSKSMDEVVTPELLTDVQRFTNNNSVIVNTNNDTKYIIIQCDKSLINTRTAKVSIQRIPSIQCEFPFTIYDGTVDILNGILTNNYLEIQQYNGETLPGRWYSDRDLYIAGTTPTIGAQVVYQLSEPETYTVESVNIPSFTNINHFYSTADNMSIIANYGENDISYNGDLISFEGYYQAGTYSDDVTDRLLNAVDTVVIESNDSIIPTIPDTEIPLYLGRFSGEEDFNTFIVTLEVTPINGNIIMYNNNEYVYRNNYWSIVRFFGTVNNTNQYLNPRINDIVYSSSDDTYYIFDGSSWEVNDLAVYLLFTLNSQEM